MTTWGSLMLYCPFVFTKCQHTTPGCTGHCPKPFHFCEDDYSALKQSLNHRVSPFILVSSRWFRCFESDSMNIFIIKEDARIVQISYVHTSTTSVYAGMFGISVSFHMAQFLSKHSQLEARVTARLKKSTIHAKTCAREAPQHTWLPCLRLSGKLKNYIHILMQFYTSPVRPECINRPQRARPPSFDCHSALAQCTVSLPAN